MTPALDEAALAAVLERELAPRLTAVQRSEIVPELVACAQMAWLEHVCRPVSLQTGEVVAYAARRGRPSGIARRLAWSLAWPLLSHNLRYSHSWSCSRDSERDRPSWPVRVALAMAQAIHAHDPTIAVPSIDHLCDCCTQAARQWERDLARVQSRFGGEPRDNSLQAGIGY